MLRTEVIKRIRRIAKAKGVQMVDDQTTREPKIFFDGVWVTTVPHHREINEHTARGAIRDCERWEKDG